MKIENLGKRATFLIPSVKVYSGDYIKNGENIAERIHKFLLKTFNGYTCASGNIFGFFQSKVNIYDELREFRVAFLENMSKTKVPLLQRFLAELCADIEEECIYLECGEDAFLIYPGD